jgi:tetratricopeptide (TPR) repeat protein
MTRLSRKLMHIGSGLIASWAAAALLLMLGNALGAYSHAIPALTLISAARAATPIAESPLAGEANAVAKPAAAPVPTVRWGDGVLKEQQYVRRAPATKPQPAMVPEKQRHTKLAANMLESAWLAYQAGHYDLARERYLQVLDGDNNVDVQLGLAAIAGRQNRNEYAVRHYQRVLSLDPRNATALAALATIGDARDAEAIEAQIRQVLEQQPSAALQFSLGNLYADQHRWHEAETAYFASYQADSRNADYAYNLAVSLDYMLQYPAALTYYLKAQALAQTGVWHLDTARMDKRIQQLQGIARQSR